MRWPHHKDACKATKAARAAQAATAPEVTPGTSSKYFSGEPPKTGSYTEITPTNYSIVTRDMAANISNARELIVPLRLLRNTAEKAEVNATRRMYRDSEALLLRALQLHMSKYDHVYNDFVILSSHLR